MSKLEPPDIDCLLCGSYECHEYACVRAKDKARIAELEKENGALKAALQWIADASDVSGACLCGRPNGIPALRAHALRHLTPNG